jgi:hypothetical protein
MANYLKICTIQGSRMASAVRRNWDDWHNRVCFRGFGRCRFVELPDVGERVTSGKPFGSVESVKSVNELFAP